MVCFECIIDMYRKKLLKKKKIMGEIFVLFFLFWKYELLNVISVLLLLIMKCIINEVNFLVEIIYNSKIIIMYIVFIK